MIRSAFALAGRKMTGRPLAMASIGAASMVIESEALTNALHTEKHRLKSSRVRLPAKKTLSPIPKTRARS